MLHGSVCYAHVAVFLIHTFELLDFLLGQLLEECNRGDTEAVIRDSFIQQDGLGETHVHAVSLRWHRVVLPPVVRVSDFKNDLGLSSVCKHGVVEVASVEGSGRGHGETPRN